MGVEVEVKTGVTVEYEPGSQERQAMALAQEIGRVLAEYGAIVDQHWQGVLAENLQPLYIALQHSIKFETLVIEDLDSFYRNRADSEQAIFWQFDGADFLCFLLDKKGQPVTLLLNSRFGRLVHRFDESGWMPTKR